MISKKRKLSKKNRLLQNNRIRISKKKRLLTKKYKKQYGGTSLKLVQQPSSHYLYYKDVQSDNTFYAYKPLQLNAAMLQYLCDNSLLNFSSLFKFSKSTSDDKSIYLGFKNFPSIVETIENKKKLSKSVKIEDKRDFTEVIEGNKDIIDRETNYRNLMNESKFKIILEKLIYQNYKNSNTQLDDIEKEEALITQDVEYVKRLISDLPRILSKIQKTKNNQKENNQKENNQKENNQNQKSEICDLSYSTDDFLIVDSKSDYHGLDGEVIIVGYPAEINPFLKLKVANPEKPDEEIYLIDLLKKTIFEDHKISETEENNYCQLLIKIFNSFKTNDIDKINENNSDDYYKLIKNNLKTNLKYIKAIITNNTNEFPNGDDSFKELEKSVNTILKELLKGIFTRPNTKIRYVFHPFIKRTDDIIEPLLYNVRELEPKHKPVLERILELIETEIPKRFNIFNDDEKSKILQGEKVRYTNFYSYYRYGDIFHIKTEYLSTTSNMDMYTHVYNRSIILEELIYSSGITMANGSLFWSKLNFQYEIRDYRFEIKSQDKSKNNSTPLKTYRLNRQIFTKLETDKIDEQFKIDKIIILRENKNSSYEIYYQAKNNKIYYLILNPILNNIDIHMSLSPLKSISKKQTVFNCFNNIVNIYSINQPLFKIDKIQEITSLLEKTKINLFRNWFFPILKRKINYNETLKKMPLLKKIRDYIGYTPFNVLKATKEIDEPINLDRIKENNPIGRDCELNKCDYYEFNKKIIFEFNNKSYILVINKHILYNKLTKYVVWIFNESDQNNQLAPSRFKNIKDLYDSSLFSEIIKKLILNGIYNPTTSYIGFNNFLSLDMESLHLHIFPKTKETYYESFIESNSYIGIEKRMESFINSYYKVKLYPKYYIDYIFVISTSVRINNL